MPVALRGGDRRHNVPLPTLAHLDETEVLDVLQGVAEPETAARVREHAADCEACRQFMAMVARAIDPASVANGSGAGRGSVRPGALIGRYRVQARLGAGGMGEVWSAHDPELDRMVAIKRLHAELREQAVKLEGEARALARLSHPNVVAVLEVVRDDDGDALVMELVDGPPLVRWQRAPGRTLSEILDCYIGAARALAAAHAAGVVHRDFKPHNVLVGPDHRARVVDFGLASLLGAAVGTGDSDCDSLGTSLVGTPAYMAPEVQAGARADARADQYSFCVALWEALSSAHPFAIEGVGTPGFGRDQALRPRPGPRPIPTSIGRALRRGLAKSPAQRFPDMDALVAALTAPRLRAAGPLVAVGTLVAAIAITRGDPLARTSACERDAAELTIAWSPDVRDDVSRTFEAAAPTRAAQALANVEAALDADIFAWQQEVASACLGDPDVGAARIRCLAQHGQELDVFVERLLRAEAETVAWATRAADALPRPDECREVVPSYDPSGADRSLVAELRRAVADTRAEMEFGPDEGTLSRAQALLDRIEPLAIASLTADARLVLGVTIYHAARIDEAGQQFERAYFEAARAGDRRVGRNAALNLARVLVEQGRQSEAGGWVRHADAMTDPSDSVAVAENRLVAATIARALGDEATAVALLTEALKLAPETSAIHPRLLTAVAEGHLRAYQPKAALELATKARAEVEQLYGSDNLELVAAENLIGAASVQLDRPAEGERAFRRALELLQAQGRADSPSIPYTRGNLALALAALGNETQAIAMLELVAEDFRRVLGPGNRNVTQSYQNLANRHLQRGAYAEALAAADTALELGRGMPERELETARSIRARSLAALDRKDEAADMWRASIAALLEQDPVDYDRLGWEQTSLANLLLSMGRQREAQVASDAALASYTLSPAARPRDRARSHLTAAKIADAMHQRGRVRREISLAWQPLLAGGMEPRELIAALEIAAWLAERPRA